MYEKDQKYIALCFENTYENTIIIIVDISIPPFLNHLFLFFFKKKSEVLFNKVQVSESDIIADCFVIPKS